MKLQGAGAHPAARRHLKKQIGPIVADLTSHRQEIIAALNLLMTGI
ncbi:MAG: hypothetical protein ACRETM_04475 [Stenotrophobium sp.]